MFEEKTIVRSIPAGNEEVTLIQALGLIPVFGESSDRTSLIQRLRIHDPVVRTWALCRLLGDDAPLTHEILAMAMHVAPRSSHLRKLLLPHLIRSYRFDLVARLSEIEAKANEKAAPLFAMLIKAEFDNQFGRLVIIHEQLYLLTGQESHIKSSLEIARSRLGWQAATKYFLRSVFTLNQPIATLGMSWLRMLERENAQKEFLLLGDLLRQLPNAKLCTAYVMAQRMFWNKDYQNCIDFLNKSNTLTAVGDKSSLFYNLAATAAEKNQDFTQAAHYYKKQNDTLKSEKLRPERYINDINERASLAIGELPADRNDNYLIMTGFPRSGTTLLENVLASHPEIATCEETSSLIGSVFAAYRVATKSDPKCTNLTARAQHHRALYYANIKRFVHNDAARVVIDKTPIISSNIKYMEKIFPNKRYLFSIRHPYDVVLSNYKQDYAQNIAMSAFNDIYDACVLYNKVMSDWFEVFPGTTERVHYIKYDDLVCSFDSTIRAALDFIGVKWVDDVNDFAENSKKRSVRTPSYIQVRKGLTIGVQSSWENFEFVFDDRCRRLLDPWVERFGY